MNQSEVFQLRTVEKKTGMTVKQEKRKGFSFCNILWEWDCESRVYGIWYTPEFGFPGKLWNPHPSCKDWRPVRED